MTWIHVNYLVGQRGSKKWHRWLLLVVHFPCIKYNYSKTCIYGSSFLMHLFVIHCLEKNQCKHVRLPRFPYILIIIIELKKTRMCTCVITDNSNGYCTIIHKYLFLSPFYHWFGCCNICFLLLYDVCELFTFR